MNLLARKFRQPAIFQFIFYPLLTASVYYGLAILARTVASTPQDVTPVWPPDGWAIAIVYLLGYRTLPGVFLGSFLSNILAFWNLSNPWELLLSTLCVVGIALGTTIGTWVGVFCLKRLVVPSQIFQRTQSVLGFFLCPGLLTPVINATFGVVMLWLDHKIGGDAAVSTWITWWISNVAGILIVTPILLSWCPSALLLGQPWHPFRHPHPWHLRPHRLAEILSIGAFGGLILYLCFGRHYPVEYTLIPVIAWAGFRFGQRGASLTTGLIAIVAILATVHGSGIFVSNNTDYSLTLLQSFISVIVFTSLILTANLAELKNAEHRLRLAFAELATTNQALEQRVNDRTEELALKNQQLEQTLQTLQQTQAQIIHMEKMSGLGQMVAGVAHEVNNPVNFIQGNLVYAQRYSQDLLQLVNLYSQYQTTPSAETLSAIQTLLHEIDLNFIQEDLDRVFSSMQNGTQRIQDIVASLRKFSRLDEAEWKRVDIHEGLASTLTLLNHRLKATSTQPEIRILQDYGELSPIECHAGELNQVFMNLLENAIDAFATGFSRESAWIPTDAPLTAPTIWIHTTHHDSQQIKITIADNGPGIPESLRSQVFDPFFTTKPVGKGTGLGLFVCYQIIVEKHGGQICCQSEPQRGSQFTIVLPIAQAAR